MPLTETGTFEVTDHYEMSSRGGFVLGHIRSGTIAPGMLVKTNSQPAVLRVLGVESISNTTEMKHLNALLFAERPTMEFVQRVFPVGFIIDVFPADEDEF